MSLTKAETKRMHESLAAWMNTPGNQPYVDQAVVQPALAKGREEGREEGHAKGRHETHIAILLQALRENDIRLSEPQKKRLRKLPCEKLPPIGAAMKATSASDFLHRAGLRDAGPNGKQRKKQ